MPNTFSLFVDEHPAWYEVACDNTMYRIYLEDNIWSIDEYLIWNSSNSDKEPEFFDDDDLDNLLEIYNHTLLGRVRS